jgi:hypothetical protein
MKHIFKKEKKDKLKKAVKLHNIRRENDILQKIENFRSTPCGFNYSHMIKRKAKRSS